MFNFSSFNDNGYTRDVLINVAWVLPLVIKDQQTYDAMKKKIKNESAQPSLLYVTRE